MSYVQFLWIEKNAIDQKRIIEMQKKLKSKRETLIGIRFKILE